MKSISGMIDQLDGLRDTTDLTDWESEFVTSILHRYLNAHRDTTCLSAKQVEIIERIWNKHFVA